MLRRAGQLIQEYVYIHRQDYFHVPFNKCLYFFFNVGKECNLEELDIKYLAHCPCADGLSCIPEKEIDGEVRSSFLLLLVSD